MAEKGGGALPIKNRRVEEWGDEQPALLTRSVYIVWAIALIGIFLAPVVVLSVSGEDAQGIEELYAGGLIFTVLVAALLAYQIEAHKRYVYELRSHALDLLVAPAAAAAVKIDVIDEVRSIERSLLDCGAYEDVAVVADARRRAESLDEQGSGGFRDR